MTHEQTFELAIVGLRSANRCGNVRTFILEREPGFVFEPGQFAWVEVESRSSLPMAIGSGIHDPHLQFSVRRNEGTEGLFGLKVGDKLSVSSAQGSAFPRTTVSTAPFCLLVAGGTGAVPIRSLLRSLPQSTPKRAVFGARSALDLLFLDELSTLDDVFLTVEAADAWSGVTGRVTEHLSPLTSNAVVFLCGPHSMMREAHRALLALGVAAHRLFLSVQALDRFGGVLGPVLAGDDPRLERILEL